MLTQGVRVSNCCCGFTAQAWTCDRAARLCDHCRRLLRRPGLSQLVHPGQERKVLAAEACRVEQCGVSRDDEQMQPALGKPVPQHEGVPLAVQLRASE